MSPEDKLADCFASLSDAFRYVKGRPTIGVLINMRLRDVIRLWLAPNDISFTRDEGVDVPPLEEEESPTVVSKGSKPLPNNLHELADLASHGVEAAQNKLQSLGEAVGVDVEECECWEHAADEIEKQQKQRKKKPK